MELSALAVRLKAMTHEAFPWLPDDSIDIRESMEASPTAVHAMLDCNASLHFIINERRTIAALDYGNLMETAPPPAALDNLLWEEFPEWLMKAREAYKEFAALHPSELQWRSIAGPNSLECGPYTPGISFAANVAAKTVMLNSVCEFDECLWGLIRTKRLEFVGNSGLLPTLFPPVQTVRKFDGL